MKETEITAKEVETINPTRDDWEKVKNLRLEALKKDPQAFGSTYESELERTDEEWMEKLEKTLGENPSEILVIAKDGDIYVGMIGAFPKDAKTWNIKAVYVKPGYRGKGVSRKLVEEILRQIDEKKDVEATQLMVNAQQEAAVRLYQSYGFDIVETAKDQKLGDGNIYDEYVMRRVKTT